METFILRYTWFTLKYLFKNLGLDLLQREGEDGLKPTSTCRFWLRLVCTYVGVDLLFLSTYCYIVLVETTPEDVLTVYKEKFFNSKTNTYVSLCNFFLFSVITFFGVFKLRILSRGLVGIQEYYKQNALIDEQATKKAMTKFLLAILPFMAILMIGVSGVYGIYVITFSSLNVPTFWQSLLFIFYFIWCMISFAPLWCFAFIYGEVSKEKSSN